MTSSAEHTALEKCYPTPPTSSPAPKETAQDCLPLLVTPHCAFQSPSLFALPAAAVFADALPCDSSQLLVQVSCLSFLGGWTDGFYFSCFSLHPPWCLAVWRVEEEFRECLFSGWLPEGPSHPHLERTKTQPPSSSAPAQRLPNKTCPCFQQVPQSASSQDP